MTATQEFPVTVRGVERWFGRRQVLRGVDLTAPSGSVTALLGRNGCGKSTLLRIVAGLLAPHRGEVRVLGCDPARLSPRQRAEMAMVGDASAVSAGTRVSEELALVRGIRRPRWDDARAAQLLQRYGVPLDQRIGALSRGQQARLRLVLALAADPQVLLLDEPGLGLDLFARRDLMEAIIETVSREGRVILISSHLIDDIERVADRIAFLRDGRIVAGGTADELRERFRRVRVKLGAGGESALLAAAQELATADGRAGAAADSPPPYRVHREAADPEHERIVTFSSYSDAALAALLEKSAARHLETRHLSLRDLYFEVLGGAAEEEHVA